MNNHIASKYNTIFIRFSCELLGVKTVSADSFRWVKFSEKNQALLIKTISSHNDTLNHAKQDI